MRPIVTRTVKWTEYGAWSPLSSTYQWHNYVPDGIRDAQECERIHQQLRNFKEIMCTLGYPRLISIENFKQPHFELVADILLWLCHRYDKNMDIMEEIRTEHDLSLIHI